MLIVTVLTTRPKGIARDIKSDIAAAVNTNQLKVLAARVARLQGSEAALQPQVRQPVVNLGA